MTASSAIISKLVAVPDAVLWTSRTWTDFAALRSPAKHLVILPLFGLADWGLGRPLDLEETLGTAVLRQALEQPAAKKLSLHLLPPLRWVLGPYPHCAFGIDYETALELLQEIAEGVRAAGFRKLVLFNTSPWNEELVDAGGRDVRVAQGLQTFAVNLSALDLDLHPVRAATRVGVQSVACACYGTLAAKESVQAEIAWSDFRPGHIRQPGSVHFDLPLDGARKSGEAILATAAKKLADLLGEIHRRKPLAHGGQIPSMRPPQVKRGSTVRSQRKK